MAVKYLNLECFSQKWSARRVTGFQAAVVVACLSPHWFTTPSSWRSQSQMLLPQSLVYFYHPAMQGSHVLAMVHADID